MPKAPSNTAEKIVEPITRRVVHAPRLVEEKERREAQPLMQPFEAVLSVEHNFIRWGIFRQVRLITTIFLVKEHVVW